MMNTLQIESNERGIATVLLNRPNKHNAMSARMIEELGECAEWLGTAGEVRIVVLAAAGKSFCSGADLRWMKSQMESSPSERRSQAKRLAAMLFAWNSVPKPVIARVHGHVFGGGIGLVSVCDAVIAAEHAKFGLTETRLGLIPATISPYVVARIGEAHARRLFMSGRIFDSEEASRYGLVTRSVSVANLDLEVQGEVSSYLSSAPGAVADAKALARNLGAAVDQDIIDHTIAQLVARWEGNEASEGVSAFFEKRKPRWIDRE